MTGKRIGTGWLGGLLPALSLAVGLLGVSAGSAHAAEWPANAYVLQIDGLACPYCGYGVEKQFARQAGVKATQIDIDKGVVVISVKPDTRFSNDELKRIVDQAGFALGGIVHRPTSG